MSVTSTAASASASFLDAYQAQITTLEKDPNATADYRSSLEKQFAAVKQQVEGGGAPSGPPGSAGPASAAPPRQPAPPGATPPFATGDRTCRPGRCRARCRP